MKRGQAWFGGIISETDPELLRLFADKIEWHIEQQAKRIEALEAEVARWRRHYELCEEAERKEAE